MDFTAEVLDKRILTDRITELDLKLIQPNSIEFLAGQFVQFIIEKEKRPYSIITTPKNTDGVSFCIDISPQGIGSKYVENLKKGDKVMLQGPTGVFTVKDRTKDLLFVATGAGVAPFKSIISDLFAANFDKKITLLFGVREQKDIFYFDFFEQLSKQNPNFKYIVTLSQPKGDWTGPVGRVTKYLGEHAQEYTDNLVYICGAPPMVKDVRGLLLSKGFPMMNIKLEVFS